MLIPMFVINIFPIKRSRVLRIISKATFHVKIFCILSVLDCLILLGIIALMVSR